MADGGSEPKLTAVLRGGPMNGHSRPIEGKVQPIIEGPCSDGTGPGWFVTYELADKETNGRMIYDFREQIDLSTDEGKAILGTISFYKNPNYDVYPIKPGQH